MGRQTEQWTISLPPSLSREAMNAARREARTRSELVREALRKYLEARSLDQLRMKVSRRFRAMGIRTQRDVERLIDEGRN
jgi:metal-responsive CopG/Arc/MetJ family transcriptional regulator